MDRYAGGRSYGADQETGTQGILQGMYNGRSVAGVRQLDRSLAAVQESVWGLADWQESNSSAGVWLIGRRSWGSWFQLRRVSYCIHFIEMILPGYLSSEI